MSTLNLAKYIDHTILKPESTLEQVKQICEEAKEYNFYSVCVNSCYAKAVTEFLADSDVETCCVVGFPLGSMDMESKGFETRKAIKDGATEIDMVINVGFVKSNDYEAVKKDINAVLQACEDKAKLKVIFETSLLTNEEIVKVAEICRDLKVAFVKTSTGFGTDGATVEHVKLMKETVGAGIEVKASGGVRSYDTAMQMVEAGATRIGTSSGIAIVQGGEGTTSY